MKNDKLVSGTIFAERFRIESFAGSGGMGVVYRAHDLQSSQMVALKLFPTLDSQQGMDRFLREATLLDEIRDPGIVKYISHGHGEAGQPFLAMEWLDGEDLSQRLRRQRLTMAESLRLIRRVAAALKQAHQRGIIHRDLKPSNLFLRDCNVDQVAVLDFGIARRTAAAQALTRSGMVIGTPEYMAPEQARGQRDVGPPADIFALGCVLFECLIGHPPFTGEHLPAVLVRILFENIPRLRTLRPEIPETMDALVGRMLAKDPAQRPRDAVALLLELSNVEVPVEAAPPDALARTLWPAAAQRAKGGEVRMASVILARPSESSGEAATLDPASHEKLRSKLESLRSILLEFGGQAELLLDGSLVVTLDDHGSASAATIKDRAAQAARLALLIRDQWPDARVAVATGRGHVNDNDSDRIPVGEVVDQAVRLLGSSSVGGNTAMHPVLIDEATAGFLDARFQVSSDSQGTLCLGSLELHADDTRPLLGRATPCVGREPELAALDILFRDCIEESTAHAVLITAPPGIGKSRLRHEFLRRVLSHRPGTTVLFGRGDPLSIGSPFGILAQALRQLCGINDSEPQEGRHLKLCRRVAQHVAQSEVSRVAEFLGEICKLPSSEQPGMLMRAARQDPQVMADQISRAWLDFLAAEASAQPTVIVLEDLHWGDSLTINLCRLALQNVTKHPLLVLALGRPEVETVLPKQLSKLTQHIMLRPLSSRASQKLVEQVLGGQVGATVVARIVEQAGGHALFLEELIRAAAEGKSEHMPKTVRALLQERIGRFEPGCRRTVCAASVFGETCWQGGIDALLGGAAGDDVLSVWMQFLCQDEILQHRLASRFPDDQEYHFRHALMREAAYELLSTEERIRGHRLAGEFLRERGETDNAKLAEHFRRGQDMVHAVHYYAKAAAQSLDAFDFDAARDCANRGLECGAVAEARGTLLSIKAELGIWREEWEEIIRLGEEAITLLSPGSVRWCRLLSSLCPAAAFTGRFAMMQSLSQRFLSIEPTAEARGNYVRVGLWLTVMLTLSGDPSRAFVDRVLQVGAAADPGDPLTLGHRLAAETSHYHMVAADPWKNVITQRAASQAFQDAGDRRAYCLVRCMYGKALMEIGDLHQAELVLRETLRKAEELGEAFNLAYAQVYLARILISPASAGESATLDEAERLASAVLPVKNPSIVGVAQGILAEVARRRGNLDDAEEWARHSSESLLSMPGNRWDVVGLLIQILIQRGKVDEAVRVGVETLAAYERGGCSTYNEVPLRLAVAAAHRAAGDLDTARAILSRALETIQHRASLIPDAALRDSYLHQVSENVQVRQLSQQWS